MSNFNLVAPFGLSLAQKNAVDSLVQGAKMGLQQVLLGVTGCGKTFVLANVLARIQRPTLIIAHNKTLAAQLYQEMRNFFPLNAVEYFVSYYDFYQPEAYLPVSDVYIEKNASINNYIERLRLSATKALLERRDVVVVASVSAIYGLGDPENYQSMVLSLFTGQKFALSKLVEQLVALQYEQKYEFVRGSFRVRGEVVEFYPAEEEKLAVSISFDDERIEKIEYFDALTHRREKTLLSVHIYPTNHYVIKKQLIQEAIKEIRQDLIQQLAAFRAKGEVAYAERLNKRVNYDLEMLEELGYCNGIENYARYFSRQQPGEPPATLLDYLPKDGLIILDESHVTLPQIRGMYRGDLARKTSLVNYGFRLPAAFDNRPLKFEEFEERKRLTIYSSATPGEYEFEHSGQIVELLVRPTAIPDPLVYIRPALNQVEDLYTEIQDVIRLQQRVLVTTLTKKMAEKLTDFLDEHGIKVRYLHADVLTLERVEILHDLRIGKFDVLVGINLLREGLDLPEVGLVAILDADKEGFLRSATALIQISGRAARNPLGKVVMYADQETKAMQSALKEMERRRKEQLAYNQRYNLIPQPVKRLITENPVGFWVENKGKKGKLKVEGLTDAAAVARKVDKLEKAMFKAAKLLEFEKAAEIRDQIKLLLEGDIEI